MNKKVLFSLLFSFIGDQFYIVFISVVLLKMNYPTSFVSAAIAMTVLPNLFLGPILGRVVDRRHKGRMHSRLSLILASLVFLFGLVVQCFPVNLTSMVLIVLFMVVYNVFASPLNTLLYHYLIPHLHKDEEYSFLVWERCQAIGQVIASVVSFILIKFNYVNLLLTIDAVSFVLCAAMISLKWSFFQDTNRESIQVNLTQSGEGKISYFSMKDKLLSFININFKKDILFSALVSVLVFVFSVDSHSYNTGTLFFKQLSINIELIPLIMSGLSLFNLLGSFVLTRFFKKSQVRQTHFYSLLFTCICLLFLSCCVLLNSVIGVIVALILLQMSEPIWSSTNTVLLRSQIKSDSYGEFFGYFRIIRSFVTSAGIYLYGVFQQQNNLSNFILIGSVLFLAIVLSEIKNNKGVYTKVSN